MIDQLRSLPSAALTADLLADARTLVVHAPGTTPTDSLAASDDLVVASSIEDALDAPGDATVAIEAWVREADDAPEDWVREADDAPEAWVREADDALDELLDRPGGVALFVRPWPLQWLLTAADDADPAVLDRFDAAYAIVDPPTEDGQTYGPSHISTPERTLDVPRTAHPPVESERVVTVRGVERALDATAIVPDLGVPVDAVVDAISATDDHAIEAPGPGPTALAVLLVRSESVDHERLADWLDEVALAPGAAERAERALGLPPGTLRGLAAAIEATGEIAVDPRVDPDFADAIDAILADHDFTAVGRAFERLTETATATTADAVGPRSGRRVDRSAVATLDVAAALADDADEPAAIVEAATTALVGDAGDSTAAIRSGVARLVARLTGDPDDCAAIAGRALGRALVGVDSDRRPSIARAAIAGTIEVLAPPAWPALVAAVQSSPGDAGVDTALIETLVDRLIAATDPVRAPPEAGVEAVTDAVVGAAIRASEDDPTLSEPVSRDPIAALGATAAAPTLAGALLEAVDRAFVRERFDHDRTVDPHPLADRVLARALVAIGDVIDDEAVATPDQFARQLDFGHAPATRRLYRAGLQAIRDGDVEAGRLALQTAWEKRDVLVPGTEGHDYALAAGAVYAGRLAIVDHPGWPAEGVLVELAEEAGEIPVQPRAVVDAVDDDRPRPDREAVESQAEDAAEGSLDALEADVIASMVDQLVEPPGPGEYFEMGCRAVIADEAESAVNGFGSAWDARSDAETDDDLWAAIAGGVAMLAHSRIDVIPPAMIYQPGVARQLDTNRDIVPDFVLDVFEGIVSEETELPDPETLAEPVDPEAEPNRIDLARVAFARIAGRLKYGESEAGLDAYPGAPEASTDLESDEEATAAESDEEATAAESDEEATAAESTVGSEDTSIAPERQASLVEGLEAIRDGRVGVAIDPLLDVWDDRPADDDPIALIAGAIVAVAAEREGLGVVADDIGPTVLDRAEAAPAAIRPVVATLDGDSPAVERSEVRERAADLPIESALLGEAIASLIAE